MEFKPGEAVKIKAEYLDRGENPGALYLVLESKGNRSLITPANWPYALKPTETVLNTMIERI